MPKCLYIENTHLVHLITHSILPFLFHSLHLELIPQIFTHLEAHVSLFVQVVLIASENGQRLIVNIHLDDSLFSSGVGVIFLYLVILNIYI